MSRRDDTRVTPELPKTMTPTIEIPDEVSLKQMKRDLCLLDPVQTICSAQPGTPVKNLLAQSHSRTCEVDDGDGNPPEIFFDATNVHSASSSSIAVHKEAPSLKQKRTSSSPAAVQTLRVSESPVKDLPTQNPYRIRKGGGKLSQSGHSRNQNRLATKSSLDGRGKLGCSAEVQHSSRNGKRKNGSFVVHGSSSTEVFSDAADVLYASSSSAEDQQEEKNILLEAKYDFGSEDLSLESKYAELRIYSDHESKSTCDGDTLSPGKTLSEDSQALELPALSEVVLDDIGVKPSLPEVVRDDLEGVEPLLPELMDDVLGRLMMLEVMKLRSTLGKALKDAIHRPAFLRNRPRSEGEFSPSFFMTDDEGDLHWHGYDTLSREWTRLPSLNFAKSILPSPNADLFKDYLVAGDGGLLCINVGKASGREKLVMCNPLTQQVKVLPPMNYARHPVLMHLKVDHDSGHYKVIVAGSAAIGTDALSLKTEEYDSRTGMWECPDGSDLPCQAFGLNEYQNGVYFKDSERELLMCCAIIGTRGRGVLVYDITKKKWAQDPHGKQLYIPLVEGVLNVDFQLASTQIVECGGSVFVFSEQECGRDVYFLIHKLIPEGSGDFTWDEVMRRKRTGKRGSLEYSEITCVPVSENELCFFNTIEHNIEIIDLRNPMGLTPLQSAPTSKGNRFHSLNPIGFVFQPSFKSVVCPARCDPEILCDLERREYCSACQRPDSESLRSDSDMNVGSKAINCQVVSAPIEEADTTTTPVESFGSGEEFFENAYKELQLFKEVLNFLGQV